MNEPAFRSRRRLWLVLGGVLLAVLAVPPATYLLIRWSAARTLAAVRSELDAEMPGWQMPDLLAARNAGLAKLPVNSADTATAAVKLVPTGYDRGEPELKWPGESDPNRLPAEADSKRLHDMQRQAEPAIAIARRLRDQPNGGTPVVVTDFGSYTANIDLTPVQERRQVARLLQLDAAAAALDNDPAAAVRAAHAGLNLARSIGDEPFLISQLVRIACTAVAVGAAERTLALTQPDAGLAELQVALGREADERPMRHGLRGELASVDQVMDNMRSGRGGGAGGGHVLNPFFALDHAASLRYIRQSLADLDRPPGDRPGLAAMATELQAGPHYRVAMSRLLAPAIDKAGEAGTRNQAVVGTAVVGVACERHRRATGNWPATLTDLPTALLAAVPSDPFDGKPLRYKRTSDGVVVYSIGRNLVDDGGRPGMADGDVVFRLYDPDKRRLPALPAAPADDRP